ncbi:MAG: antibiotic biosynthesis monooxygenase [Bacillota bacterium]|nr:antibiotic biosynthesis monooxygenase [Bacillota bacterium]
MLFKSVTLYVKSEKIDEFIEATLENQRSSRMEEGILCFDFFQCKDDLTRFLLHEGYKTEEAVEAHMKTEHYKKWVGTAEHCFSGPRERAIYIPVEAEK